MRIGKLIRSIIRDANELGYFPTAKQAREIQNVYSIRFGYEALRLTFEEVLDGVMSGKLTFKNELARAQARSDAENEKRRQSFYAGPVGKALIEGRAKAWPPGQTIEGRGIEMGISLTPENVESVKWLAGCGTWNGISDREWHAAIDLVIESFIQYRLTRVAA